MQVAAEQHPQSCVLSLPVPCRVWASGVGYGHDQGGGADDIWNASAAEAAQAAHDAELQKLLDELTASLRQQLERSTGEPVLVFVALTWMPTAWPELSQAFCCHLLVAFCAHTLLWQYSAVT